MTRQSNTYMAHAIADQLRAEGTPFAVATVVRTLASTAAKPGMKALVLGNGDFADGWLGGGCVTAAVKKAAIVAIKTGKATLVCLRPEELLADIEDAAEDGMVQVVYNGCPSKGSMDIFVEPVKPQPELLVFGSGPVASALLRISSSFGFSLVLCGEIEHAIADRQYASLMEMDSAALPDVDRYVVVATQGKGDVATLTAALKMGATYIAFVGSRRKFASFEDKLTNAGVSAKKIATVRSPAGVQINAVTPDEIALSIMAEIIQTRRTAGQQRGTDDAC
ncbi:XdhC family protein [Alphaproteobacteria bacterium]|jgi:xanthine dehydrogenase accessory factor|nr:XdhC family protein [Alphaproteobacteria bacterium]MDC1169648.1 XdhC family protein [bacterium]MDA8723294.1 XdhC family protein [Alphaproteobacteria bacterium]MDA9897258.1 XdhC family protein [Alphaproteobacteria bacterium]MDB2531966.1 XdhC family protein [Alphaproteobacteria bacterium]